MQTINLAEFTGNTGIGVAVTGSRNDKAGGQVKNGAIYAGNINNVIDDRIGQKRAQARKQATKIIMDQFASDGKVVDDMNGRRERNKQIKEELSFLSEERKGYELEQEALKERYGITDDSKERADLELLRRARKSLGSGAAGFNKEEWTRIADMGGLTEYQKRALEYDRVIERIDEQVNGLKQERMENDEAIKSGKNILLKTSFNIVEAKEAADSVMDAASDEIIGMLWDEAKKHVEEELEKLLEEAEEAAEKKEEEEEKLDSIKEEKEEKEKLTEEIQESVSEQGKLLSEIDKILKDSELLEEDLKGLMVDGTL